MAKRIVTVCDMENQTCRGDVATWQLTPPRGQSAREVDLCQHHAKPLHAAEQAATRTGEVVGRKRRTVKPTVLKKE